MVMEKDVAMNTMAKKILELEKVVEYVKTEKRTPYQKNQERLQRSISTRRNSSGEIKILVGSVSKELIAIEVKMEDGIPR